MRIGIDASGAAKPKRTGIGRYVVSLVEGILRTAPGDEVVLAVRLSRIRMRRHFLRAAGARIRLFQEPFTGWMRRELDLFHGPDLRLPATAPVPLVATIHDAFSLTSDVFSRESHRRKRIPLYRDALRRAAAVITVSEASRARLCEALGIDEDRVRVVPLGVDSRFRTHAPEEVDAVRRRHALPDSYVLYVGQVSRRKNLPRLVEAFGRVAAGRSDLHLILAGRPTYGAEETFAVQKSSPVRDRIRLTDHFPDDDLPALYAGAEAVVLPSLDEGFGLPAIEGMACGTPVVVSTAGALPEVAAGAAETFEAENTDQLEAALRRILEDEDLRRSLRERGIRRAAELTWDRCAEETLGVYREAVSA
jgi:glycosyltransferase involved in cell wall biosynthesis